MDTPAYLNAVVGQTNTLAQWAADNDPTTPVPTCPEWNLGDLVDHIGATQLMVAVLVGERLTDPSSAFEAYSPAPSDSALWHDWLDTMTSRGYWENVAGFAEAMSGTGQTFRFRASDTDGDWIARREEDRIVLAHGPGATAESAGPGADVTVEGPAVELMLVISRRRPLASARSLVVDGDRALIEHWIDHMDWVAA